MANIDIAAEIAFHSSAACKATVACVRPPARFGRVVIEGTQATSFEEKPQAEGGLINGGFFVLEPSVLELIDGAHTVWEKEPMETLAADGQLAAWVHRGLLAADGYAARQAAPQCAVGQRRRAVEALAGLDADGVGPRDRAAAPAAADCP